jgi:hypothetical protein
LALIYNAPRAASIVCKEEAICLTLDRACFNNIVKNAAVKKRERYAEFLGQFQIWTLWIVMSEARFATTCIALRNFVGGRPRFFSMARVTTSAPGIVEVCTEGSHYSGHGAIEGRLD